MIRRKKKKGAVPYLLFFVVYEEIPKDLKEDFTNTFF